MYLEARNRMYTLYYHKDCPECAKQAAIDSKLDWLNRISVSTEIPPTGELEKGEIVLISKNGQVFTRGYAIRKISLNIPVYFFLAWFCIFLHFLNWPQKVKLVATGIIVRLIRNKSISYAPSAPDAVKLRWLMRR